MSNSARIGTVDKVFSGAPALFMNRGFDTGVLRPVLTNDEKSVVSVATRRGGSIKRNAEGAIEYERILHGNALLRKDEWIELDSAVTGIASVELGALSRLRGVAGLERRLGGLGTTIATYSKMGDMDDAVMSMSPRDRSDQDTTTWDMGGTPVPLTHKGFNIDIRQLDASRRMGDGLDVTNGMVAARKVAEKLEETLFNGSNISVGGYTIPGFTNFSEANTDSLISAWDGTSPDPLKDVQKMIRAARSVNYRGPYGLFIPEDYSEVIGDDYKATSDTSVLEKLLQISGISFVQTTSYLTDKIVLQQLTPDCIRINVAQEIVTVQWDGIGGLLDNFLVFAAIVPTLKSDAKGNSGTVVFSE